MENSSYLLDKSNEIFELFKNIISQKFFQYLNENLLVLLTKFILNFSFLITNSVYPTQTQSNESSIFRPLSKQQQFDIKSCVELLEKIIQHITTTVCINYVVLSLCELLDVTWQNKLNRSDLPVNRSENPANDSSDPTIKIYEVNLIF